ncbi:isocitrate lyase/phosphoenolpyruvate mutase family protein [Exilibacterium tricleocarpae]|uniref:Isocitrate lyase/phosphoenolpyruvate mutase family protein n=1 Tax=Exilibacterium tricleocarpae TaxID=2591008 RepID=A0A545TFM1_9GAMM|nr:isocitrate lyase/phosphoenolpyruvate mutase family protein [Exilibacterium tricleocarpae]TQV76027.1 isocitrate lyase/phosphoenolpyruvate mutase family protein [Exilibacterium tricleocarpae]
MIKNQKDKAAKFAAQHRTDGCFIMPNAWDIASARLLAAAGFSSIGTTSAGIAFSLGCPDHTSAGNPRRMDRKRMIDRVAAIAAAVDVPVNADLEAGYGTTATEVAKTITHAIAAGAVGANIEDFTGNPHAPLLECERAVEHLIAAREAATASGIAFTLNGRTDGFLVGAADALRESIHRANRYAEAGADCLFIPGVSDAATIAALVEEIDAPLNVVMGLTGNDLNRQQLQNLGVRRISIGGSLARASLALVAQAAQEMATRGTFTFAERQLPQERINRLLAKN